MTFMYELDPYSLEMYRTCKYDLPISRLSKVIIRQTDRHVQNYIPRRWLVYGHSNADPRSQKLCDKLSVFPFLLYLYLRSSMPSSPGKMLSFASHIHSGTNVMERKGTPFPHLQFMTQSVPPPQIVILLGKGTRPLSRAQT